MLPRQSNHAGWKSEQHICFLTPQVYRIWRCRSYRFTSLKENFTTSPESCGIASTGAVRLHCTTETFCRFMFPCCTICLRSDPQATIEVQSSFAVEPPLAGCLYLENQRTLQPLGSNDCSGFLVVFTSVALLCRQRRRMVTDEIREKPWHPVSLSPYRLAGFTPGSSPRFLKQQ